MTLRKKYILTIDQSTSATKALLFDNRASLVHRISKPHKQYYPEPGFVEHDAEEIYHNVLEVMKEILDQTSVATGDIACLSITNQRETALIWDRHSGKPVARAAVWQCQRGVDICNQLKNDGLGEMVRRKTGLIIDPYFSASKLQWIMDHNPDLKTKAADGDLLMGTMDAWLIWKLTGGKVHATDHTNACRTMLYNIHTLEWDEELVSMFGLHPSMLPQVKFSDEIFGETTALTGFGSPLPIAGPIGDSHAALFGQHCFSAGMTKVTYGTGSSIMMNIGSEAREAPAGLVTSIGFGCNRSVDYVFEGNIHCTGDTISWLANGFNQVVMNVYAYDVSWRTAGDVPAAYDFSEPKYSPFMGNNDEPDFSLLNTEFFRHFDRVIHELYRQGIVAHLMIYVWNKNVTWPDMYSTADNRYFDYILKRYQGYPNIIWDVSKEALDYGRCDIPYINERIERIRNADAFDHLVTVHDYEYCAVEPDRVDFISIQNWRSDLYSYSLEAALRHQDKPVMNIEHGGYEAGPYNSFTGNYTDPETCLIRNYECVFGGVYSTYYWQNTSWNIVIWDPMDPEHIFTRPRFDYYRHMQDLFTRYKFNELTAFKAKLTTNGRTGNDNLSTSGYPLTNGKDLFLFLVPSENELINVVLPEPPERQMEVRWFNPFTGEYSESVTMPWRSWMGFSSPWPGIYSILIINLK